MLFTAHNASSLSAIIPTYTTTGDSTTIYFTNGTNIMQNIRTKALLNRLAKALAYDLNTVRKISRQNTNSYLLSPLPLTSSLILMPIKIRTPRVRGDTSMGYINATQNITVRQGRIKGYKSLLVLPNEIYLDCLWDVNTVVRRLQVAKALVLYTPYFPSLYVSENDQTSDIMSLMQNIALVFYELSLFQQTTLRR